MRCCKLVSADKCNDFLVKFILLFDCFHLPETVIQVMAILDADSFVDFRTVQDEMKMEK